MKNILASIVSSLMLLQAQEPLPDVVDMRINGPVYVSHVSTNYVDIKWRFTDKSINRVKVSQSPDGVQYEEIGIVPVEVGSSPLYGGKYHIYNLNPNETYFFKISEVNKNTSLVVREHVINITTQPVKLVEPDGLRFLLIQPDRIDIAWNDNSEDEDGFVIERSIAGKPFEQIQITDPEVNTFSDTNVTPDTTYYYRVKAIADKGESKFSRALRVRTLNSIVNAQPREPAPRYSIPDEPPVRAILNVRPYKVEVKLTSPNAVQISWVNGEPDFTDNIKVEESTDGVNFYEVATIPLTTYYVRTLLKEGVTYYYRIIASNRWGTTLPSDSVSVIIPQHFPPLPPVPVSQ